VAKKLRKKRERVGECGFYFIFFVNKKKGLLIKHEKTKKYKEYLKLRLLSLFFLINFVINCFNLKYKIFKKEFKKK
jgi:hypothetical protein